MKESEYLILEVHESYAIVLESNGRIVKAANLGYQAGDRTNNIIEFRYEDRIPFWKVFLAIQVLN